MSVLALPAVQWLLNALQIVLALGAIILVHELGHYLTAKLVGMKVDEFSVGIGPTLAKWESKGTRYRLAPFLVMGYVRIRGMEGEELLGTADAPDRREPSSSAGAEPAGRAAPEPGSFYHSSYAQRILVLVGGALLNLVFAAAVFAMVYGWWGQPDERVDTVLAAVQPGSAADQAGLTAGDRIKAINGQATADAAVVEKLISGSRGAALRLTVSRASGASEDRTLQPRLDAASGKYRIGVVFRSDGASEPVIDRVTPGGPADRAGLQSGDRIIRLDSEPVRDAAQIADQLTTVPADMERASAREVTLPTVQVSVERDSAVLVLPLTPQPDKAEREKPLAPGEQANPDQTRPLESYLVGDPGFTLLRRMQRMSAWEAVKLGAADTLSLVSRVTVGTLDLFRGRGLNQVGGPVMIVKSLSNAAEGGLFDLLTWTASLSVMIGVFNLLPLPALDGGRVVFVVIDAVASLLRRRPFISRQTEGWIHLVGLVMLLLLMLVVTVRDVTR